VHNLGGWFKLESSVGHGTTLSVSLPTIAQAQPDHLVRDPVCSAVIEPQQAYASCDYGNTTYYFCCPVCQGAFQKDPELYIGAGKAVDVQPSG